MKDDVMVDSIIDENLEDDEENHIMDFTLVQVGYIILLPTLWCMSILLLLVHSDVTWRGRRGGVHVSSFAPYPHTSAPIPGLGLLFTSLSRWKPTRHGLLLTARHSQ